MNYRESLSQKAIAISISDSPDMAVLGLAEEHLRDAMAEIARHLLALGARLVYGGDLRIHGFTEILFELVARHRRDADVGDNRAAVLSYLAFPVHSTESAEEIKTLAKNLTGLADLQCLDMNGNVLPLTALQAEPAKEVTDEEWAIGLTSMRRVTTSASNVRIVLGGRVLEFKGTMPGIAEEALYAIDANQPLFILGGFGGCARDIAEMIGLVKPREYFEFGWAGMEKFADINPVTLRNGLDELENATLARTVHIDEAIALILRGLMRLFSKP
jgi:hypothetical protein